MKIPVFNIKRLEKQLKRRETAAESDLDYLHAASIMAGNEQATLKVQRYRELIGKGIPKRKWEPPFHLDTKGIWEMYAWNFARPPIPRATVTSQYAEWFRLNYDMAAYSRDYQCLLRSPAFWKTLYVQHLVDTSPHSSRWTSRIRDDDRKEKIFDEATCGGTRLYTYGALPMYPQPLWVVYRFIFGKRKFIDFILAEKNWIASGGLSAKRLMKVDPLFREAWKGDYRINLHSLQDEFVHLKMGKATLIGRPIGSVNQGEYGLEFAFRIPMNIDRVFPSITFRSADSDFAGIKQIRGMEGSFQLGPSSVFHVQIDAPPGQTVDQSMVEDSIRRIIISMRPEVEHKELLDIILSKEWEVA